MQDGATGQIYRPSVQSLHMSDFYVSDSWAMGRWNIINLNAKQQRIQSVRFSNPYRPYAHYNGLCSFDAGNSRIIPFRISGEITALRYAGGVMLVLCETRLVSLYIGERIITSAEGAESPGFMCESWNTNDFKIIKHKPSDIAKIMNNVE